MVFMSEETCSMCSKKISLDFVLYHRKGQDIQKPKKGKPKYLMLALSEEEYLSGERMADAIEECKAVGLDLILGIADRESSVTFYAVKRISIPASEFEYYLADLNASAILVLDDSDSPAIEVAGKFRI